MLSLSLGRARLRGIVLDRWHGALRTLVAARRPAGSVQPEKILLINGAHMGDVVIATSLLPVLKSAFPGAAIGFLTGSWANCVVRNHPLVSFTHQADHWRMNRSAQSWFGKRRQYWLSRRRALAEIKNVGYDAAICMHPWRADFLPLAWQAKIPVRLAFSESLFAPLATVTADYPEQNRFIHQSDCQMRLLTAWGVPGEHIEKKRASLAPSGSAAMREVCEVLQVEHLQQASYSVIHMGAGCEAKEAPADFWRDVARRIPAHEPILFTGKGAREFKKVEPFTQGVRNRVNACDRLSWEGLVAAIRFAKAFYGVDSLAAHIAAAVGTKCVALFGGMNNPARFRPESDRAVVWTNAMACCGCGRQFGCEDMACMRGFAVDKILQIQNASAV